jgi:phage shock protein A
MRLFRAEANSAVDQLEDPIKMTEQGIRDLRNDMISSLKSLAEAKALALQQKREMEDQKTLAADYEKKAMLILQKVKESQMDKAEGDRLALEALNKKENAVKRASTIAGDLSGQDSMVAQLEGNIKSLKSKIAQWENELTTLKARSKVATATRKVNEQMAKVDSSGTIAMLEKMRNKVAEEESLAQSYGEIAQVETSLDEEINRAAAGAGAPASAALEDLKKKMGM